jgi:hypothetical protein
VRKRSKNLVGISEVFSSSRGFKLSSNPVFEIGQKWEKIAGPAVAIHSHPVKLLGGLLILRVDSPSWMQELTFLRHMLIEKISAECKRTKVRDIRFEVGDLPKQKQEQLENVQKREVSLEEKEFIDIAAKQISDEEIAGFARSAMMSYFRQGKEVQSKRNRK